MKTSELREIYSGLCKSRNMTPDETDFQAWKKKLIEFDGKDVKDAVIEWRANQEPDERGFVAPLPLPTQLEYIVRRNLRLKKAQTRVDYCGNCFLGRVKVIRDGKWAIEDCKCKARVVEAMRVKEIA